MRHIKPGRGPSALGALGGIIAVVFGVFWTAMAFSMTRGAPEPFASFFPFFGVLFVVIGIANVGYNLYNATQRKRMSVFDIATSAEESDPLNDLVEGRDPRGEQNCGGEPIESKLRELEALRGKGLVTEAEYAAQRRRILNSI